MWAKAAPLTPALLVIAIVVALAGCTAPAHPSPWESYRDGFVIMHGTDAAGGQWTDTSYRSGVTTYDANGPHGEQQRCRSWQQGWQTITECD